MLKEKEKTAKKMNLTSTSFKGTISRSLLGPFLYREPGLFNQGTLAYTILTFYGIFLRILKFS